MQNIPNKSDKIKPRLSALAQLVELLGECKGISSTKELAEATGYTRRAIRKARAELQFRNYSTGTMVPEPRFRSGTPVPQNGTLFPAEQKQKKERSPPTPPSKEKKQKTDSCSNRFDEFWQIYPRKLAKKNAQKAFTKALKVAPADQIIRAVEEQRGGLDSDQQYIPHAATWLNAERWQDPLPDANQKQPESDFARYMKRTNGHAPTEPCETDEMRQLKREMGLL